MYVKIGCLPSADAVCDVNGEVEMQGEEEESNVMQCNSLSNNDNQTPDTTATDKDGTPSISRLNVDDKASSEKTLAANTSTHILCNGFGGEGPSPESNGQCAGEGGEMSNGLKGELADVSPVNTKLNSEGGDTPLPQPVTLTDTAITEKSHRLSGGEPEEDGNQQGDSGFGSTTFELVGMESQDSQNGSSLPHGE